MAITTETPRAPDFWLLVAEEDGRVLTVGEDAAPAVFSGEGEAELFLHLGAGGGRRRVRKTSPRELASLLCGPSCAGATRVALDPSPEMLSSECLVELVSVRKGRFLERFAKLGLRGSEFPLPEFCGEPRVVTEVEMSREEIERAMEEVGWKIDAGFADELVIGYDSVVSILAYPWAWEADEPAFEISHEVEDATYWVREIPTPMRALELIAKNGGPPEEERGRPNEPDGGE